MAATMTGSDAKANRYSLADWICAARAVTGEMKQKCRKRRFATKEETRRAIAAMASKWSFVYKRAYRCGACKAYHITSTPRVSGRGRRQW